MKGSLKFLPLFFALLLGIGAAFGAHHGKPFANTLKYWNGSAWIVVPSGHTVSCDNQTTINCKQEFDSDGNPVAGTLVKGMATLN